MSAPAGTTPLLVPVGRVARWVANFAERHEGVELLVEGGALHGRGADGSTFVARLPFDRAYDGEPEPAAFVEAMRPPQVWGLLLVRKGGFAVARLAGERMVEHKVGQRHVQGRSKAGGQSQQRFARRRDNQAKQAYSAAADHAARILRVTQVVVGGDRDALDAVLGDSRLSALEVVGARLPVADPRRKVLDQAVEDAQAARVEVHNA